MAIAIFCYGTLMRGGRFAREFNKDRKDVVQVKITEHKLYSNKVYPLMVQTGNPKDKVRGEIHLYNNAEDVLKRMHRIKGYREHDREHSLFTFDKVSKAVLDRKEPRVVWSYVWNGSIENKEEIKSGSWYRQNDTDTRKKRRRPRGS